MTAPVAISAPAGVSAAGRADVVEVSGSPSRLRPIFFLAWLLCAIFYFFQYAVRSAPGGMQQELTSAWGGNRIGAMISAYYVAYALMALVAGLLLDRYGPAESSRAALRSWLRAA